MQCLLPHGLYPVNLTSSWNFPGKNTAVGCHFPLQGIFPSLGSNLYFLIFPALARRFFTTAPPIKLHLNNYFYDFYLGQFSISARKMTTNLAAQTNTHLLTHSFIGQKSGHIQLSCMLRFSQGKSKWLSGWDPICGIMDESTYKIILAVSENSLSQQISSINWASSICVC